MGSRILSPATMAWLFCAMAVVHAGLLTVMVLPAIRPSPPPTGEAAVIHLTLSPVLRTDGRDPVEAKAAHTRSTTTAPLIRAPARLRTPVPSRLTPVETVSPSTPSPAHLPMSSPTTGAAVTPRGGAVQGQNEAHHEQPDGGGGRVLGAAEAPLEDQYAAQVIAWVERRKGSPGGGLSGVVVLRFVLDRQGRLRDAAVVSVLGDRRAGLIALDTLKAAQPFPRPPADTTWRTREFHVRLDYRLRDQ